MPAGFTHYQEHRVAIIGRSKIGSIPIAIKNSFPNPVLLLQNFQEMFSYFILKLSVVVIQHKI